MHKLVMFMVMVSLVLYACSSTQVTIQAPELTNTPIPTDTAQPTSTPKPATATPMPTAIPTAMPTSTSTPVPTPTPTPEPVWLNGFQLGAVVTGDQAEYFGLMKASGITWVRYSLSDRNEPSVLTQIAEVAHSNGMKLFVTVNGARDQSFDNESNAKFVSRIVMVAQQGADAIEVLNQPNYGVARRNLNPEVYTALLCDAHKAIKDVSSEILVISGSLDKADDETPWLPRMMKAGALDCLDYVGVLYIIGSVSPSAVTSTRNRTARSVSLSEFVAGFDSILQNKRPIALTRFGYATAEGYGTLPDWINWASKTTLADQAEWTAEAVKISAEEGKVGMMMFEYLNWAHENDNGPGAWALIRKDGTCPACVALRELLIKQR